MTAAEILFVPFQREATGRKFQVVVRAEGHGDDDDERYDDEGKDRIDVSAKRQGASVDGRSHDCAPISRSKRSVLLKTRARIVTKSVNTPTRAEAKGQSSTSRIC